MKKILVLLGCLFYFLSACDQIQKVTDFFFKEEKASKKDSTAKKSKKKSGASKKETEAEKEGDSSDAEKSLENVNKENLRKEEASLSEGDEPLDSLLPDLPDASPRTKPSQGQDASLPPGEASQEDVPENKPSPEQPFPLSTIDHIGGKMTSIHFDGNMLFAGFGKKLVWYDSLLNPIGSLNLESPALQVYSYKSNNETAAFIACEKNILEAIRISADGQGSSINSFEADGPFEVFLSPLDGRILLYVYLDDKIQVLDLSNLKEVKVVREIPVSHASQTYSLGEFQYIVSGATLNVVHEKRGEILSSVSLGSPFKILGSRVDPIETSLILAFKKEGANPGESPQWRSIQFLPLIPGGGGIADLGKSYELNPPADDVNTDNVFPYLYLLQNGNAALFDLKGRSEIKPVSSPTVAPITKMKGNGEVIFASGEGLLGRLKFQISSYPEEPKKNPLLPGGPTEAKSAKEEPVPLAYPSPAVQTTGSFKWLEEKIMPVPSAISALLLPGSDALMIINSLAKDNANLAPVLGVRGGSPTAVSPTGASTTATSSIGFLLNASKIVPVVSSLKGPFDINMISTLKQGILSYDQKGKRVLWIKKDLSALQEIKLGAKPPGSSVIRGLDGVTDEKGSLLYLSFFHPEKNTENLSVYAWDVGRSSARLLNTLPLSGAGGFKIFGEGKKGLVACGMQGVCLVDVGTERSKIKLLSTLPPPQQGAIALEVMIEPDESVGYVLFKKPQGGFFVLTVGLTTEAPIVFSSIPDVAITEAQFRGLSFSGGGKRLLLPQKNGLGVYDVKNPKSPTLSFVWPVGEVLGADVTNRGKTVCVALGPNGADCGEF